MSKELKVLEAGLAPTTLQDTVFNKTVMINGKKATSVQAIETIHNVKDVLTKVIVTFTIKKDSLKITEPDEKGHQIISFDYLEEEVQP